LLLETGPLAVTSANQHGSPPCHHVDEIVACFADGALDAIVDGGRRDGVVSTVLDLSVDPWVIRREGAITHDQLATVLDGSIGRPSDQ